MQLISVTTAIAILFIGFSIFSAIVLSFTHFNQEHYQNLLLSRGMGLMLLLGLCGLQIAHFFWLYLDQPWVATVAYRVLLFTIAPTFFLFSYPIICTRDIDFPKPVHWGHAIPILCASFVPANLALALAFIVGSGYLLWLALRIYQLRNEREHFRVEMVLLGIIFMIAIGVSVLGFVPTLLPEKLFFSIYASSIGLGFLLVQITLGLRPNLSAEVTESMQTAYSSSTLNSIDCDAILLKLDALMQVDKIYRDSSLALPGLAAYLSLSTHQASELINTRLGKNFSRYLRELRINAAKAMLCDEPSASVLSVGLSVGFTTQSTFYEAFREIEGMPPGQYRKLHTASKSQ